MYKEVKKKFFFCFFILILGIPICFFAESRHDYINKKRMRLCRSQENNLGTSFYKRKKCFLVSKSLKGAVFDAFQLHTNIFSCDSLKIVFMTVPFFIGSRIVDGHLQDHFFDHKEKKNINGPPKWFKDVAKYSIAPAIVLLGSKAFFSYDREEQITAQVMLTGIPFVFAAKDLIKKLRFKACLRPYHEKFSPEVRCPGGFPSGHIAEITYLATLYGIRYGFSYGFPLGLLAIFVGGTFLSCNRHYLSQMIAGASFGAIYAVAANKVVEDKICYERSMHFDLNFSAEKGVNLSFNMRF